MVSWKSVEDDCLDMFDSLPIIHYSPLTIHRFLLTFAIH